MSEPGHSGGRVLPLVLLVAALTLLVGGAWAWRTSSGSPVDRVQRALAPGMSLSELVGVAHDPGRSFLLELEAKGHARAVHFRRDQVVVHPALSAPGETDPAARRTTTVVEAISALDADIARTTTVSAWRVTVRWAQDPTPLPDLDVELDGQGRITNSSVR